MSSRESSGTMSIDEVSVLECPDLGCTGNFRSVEDMELHITVGKRRESIYVKLRRDWVDKFTPLTTQKVRVLPAMKGSMASFPLKCQKGIGPPQIEGRLCSVL